MHHLDPDDPRPPYQQVSETLGKEIVSGRYGPGDKLPPHRQVADDFGVSVGTIYRAIGSGQLAALKLGRGTFRVPGAAVLAYEAACAQAASDRAVAS